MKAAGILKTKLEREAMTYGRIKKRIGDKDVNDRNKISRGKFSAAFMLQRLESISIENMGSSHPLASL